MEILLRLGDLTEVEILERCEGDGLAMLRLLAADGRALSIEIAGEKRWIAGEERHLYAASGEEEHLETLLERYLQHRGPAFPDEFRRRYGLTRARAERAAERFLASGSVVRGHFLPTAPSGDEVQWAYRPNLERIQRQTIALLRREISPVGLDTFALFLQQWQKVNARPSSQIVGEDLLEVLAQLQGLPLPADIWERDILPRRLTGPVREALDRETLSGSVERHLHDYFQSFGEGLPPPGLYHRILREVENPLIAAALASTRGNQIKAAELLGVNRNTLRKKIRELDIQIIRSAR